jgi:hypothetical protein
MPGAGKASAEDQAAGGRSGGPYPAWGAARTPAAKIVMVVAGVSPSASALAGRTLVQAGVQWHAWPGL